MNPEGQLRSNNNSYLDLLIIDKEIKNYYLAITNQIPETNKLLIDPNSTRLNLLQQEKILTKRIFENISENMHYEIFKYLTSNDLLEVRFTKLGGYQLTTNKTLRPRIKNYFECIKYIIDENMEQFEVNEENKKIDLIFEQTGKEILEIYINNQDIHYLSQIFEANSHIKGITSSKISLYIYLDINEIGENGRQSTFAGYLKFIRLLEILNLSNYNKLPIIQ